MLPIQKQTNLNRQLYQRALFDSFNKLDPRQQIHNPMLFTLEMISLLLTGLWLGAMVEGNSVRVEVVAGTVALWFGLTVLFINFTDALAAGLSKTQAESLDWPHHPIKIKWLKLPPSHD